MSHFKKDKDNEKEKMIDKKRGIQQYDYHNYVLIMVVVLFLFFGAGVKYARYVDGRPLIPVAVASNILPTADFNSPKTEGDIVVKIIGEANKVGHFSFNTNTSLREVIGYVGVKPVGSIEDFDFFHKPENGDVYYIKNTENPVDITPWLENDITKNYEDTTVKAEDNSDKININSADVEELSTLKGIGEVRGKAIIEYRKAIGGYTRIEEILGVEGIGESIYREIKDKICV